LDEAKMKMNIDLRVRGHHLESPTNCN